MYTLEKSNTSPLCILCMLMPQIIPLLTLMLVHMWYEEFAPAKLITFGSKDIASFWNSREHLGENVKQEYNSVKGSSACLTTSKSQWVWTTRLVLAPRGGVGGGGGGRYILTNGDCWLLTTPRFIEGTRISTQGTGLVPATFGYGIEKNLWKLKLLGGARGGVVAMAMAMAKWSSETKENTLDEHTRNKLCFFRKYKDTKST